jgi:hypothetical protein
MMSCWRTQACIEGCRPAEGHCEWEAREDSHRAALKQAAHAAMDVALRAEVERLRALVESECRRAEDAHGGSQRASLEIERLRAALQWIEQQEPATHEVTLAHQMAQLARDTLRGR